MTFLGPFKPKQEQNQKFDPSPHPIMLPLPGGGIRQFLQVKIPMRIYLILSFFQMWNMWCRDVAKILQNWKN